MANTELELSLMRRVTPHCVPLVALLAVALLISGCGDTAAVSEKQAIEQTYGVLVHKANQLQGVSAASKRSEIAYAFESALLEATSDAYRSPDAGGKSVAVQLPGGGWLDDTMTTTLGALRTLVKYEGNGTWSLSIKIKNWEFAFDERTGDVTGQSEDAKRLLEAITLKTYHSSAYEYYVDYPPGWVVNEEQSDRVMISAPGLDAFLLIGVIGEAELARHGGLGGYVEARITTSRTSYYEFELGEVTPTRLAYTYMLRQGMARYEARHYFVQYRDWTYEILASARKLEFESLSALYDPHLSLRFQP